MSTPMALQDGRHTAGKIVRLLADVQCCTPADWDWVESGGSIMRVLSIASVSQIVLVAGAGLALAQDRSDAPATGAPGVVIEGSGNTSIGGQSAARKGDRTDGGGAIVEGSKDVFINGKPAATTGDRTGCGGITVGGGGGVFINGKPAARAGDLTTGCSNK